MDAQTAALRDLLALQTRRIAALEDVVTTLLIQAGGRGELTEQQMAIVAPRVDPTGNRMATTELVQDIGMVSGDFDAWVSQADWND